MDNISLTLQLRPCVENKFLIFDLGVCVVMNITSLYENVLMQFAALFVIYNSLYTFSVPKTKKDTRKRNKNELLLVIIE